MTERDEIVDELKHLIRYYRQAAHEFFDETSVELQERLESVRHCLEENKNTIEDYKKMTEMVVKMQKSLEHRVSGLRCLTKQMEKLFEGPR